MVTVQRRVIIIALLLAIGLAAIGVLFWWLWGVLDGYIQPKTPADKKDLVNVFVVMAAGVIGTLTAIAAVGNLIISRRNLQNAQATLQHQRDLDERRAQDDALQAYFEQMGDLLTTHKLMETKRDDPIRLLARAQTLTLLERLDPDSSRAMQKKRELILFLYDAGLLKKRNTIVDLDSATLIYANLIGVDLIGANFSGADLMGADLSDANLSDANLSDTILIGTILMSADLSGADLMGADLSGANLSYAKVTDEQLSNCVSLEGTTMRDGSTHE
jgi:uncharacterized protein YjbI with pentapeptide repeats